MNSSKDIMGKLQGAVINFRIGPKTQHSKECIIQFPSITTAEQAARLIGRKVACPVQKRVLKGGIVALHGKNGMVRARFRKGLPGKLGARIVIIG